jgi:hypothetical protein
MKQEISVCCALLVALSISATATAAPQKRERPHRPSLVEVIEHRVMAVVAVVEGSIAREARAAMEAKIRAAMEAKLRAAMEAKARAAMEAKAEAAMAAKAEAAMAKRNAQSSDAQAPCPYDPNKSRSATDVPSLDKSKCPRQTVWWEQ